MSARVPTLQELFELGYLAPVDLHFAQALARLGGETPATVALAAAAASRAVGAGHVCAELPVLAGSQVIDAEGLAQDELCWPELGRWRSELAASPLVGDGRAQEQTPLVLAGGCRLYLHRYWDYERRLAAALRERAQETSPGGDAGVLRDGLRRLFPADAEAAGAVRRQRLAAAVAVLRSLCVISGGPGTGKTTTVVRVLALLLEQARAAGGRFPLRIVLLAPTGKAAARLSEAIAAGREQLARRGAIDEQIRQAIPDDAATIHRRLGFQRERPTRFRHHAENPLAADVVVVDEASMVDLALMTKLIEAVPRGARLILLGDRDQLASVEAGAILGDICRTGAVRPGFSTAFAARLEEALGEPLPPSLTTRAAAGAGLGDSIVELTHSWRFAAHGGIGVLAGAIGSGDGEAALEMLGASAAEAEVALITVADNDGPEAFVARYVVPALRGFLAAREPREALLRLGDFRVLCAHRRGRFGAEYVNRAIETELARRGFIRPDRAWYPHRPIMITANDYQLELFNGDIGVVLPGPGRGGVRAYFASGAGDRLRSFVPARLPPHETVFAMTVHKSQGSELDQVALLLPHQISSILTRELLYTGVTRARRRLLILGGEAVIRAAAARRIRRASGLREALWEGQ